MLRFQWLQQLRVTKNCNICTPKRGNEHPSRQDLWGRNINYFEKQETRGRKKVRNRDNFNFFWKKKRQNNYLNSPHNWKACYLKQMTRRSGVVTSSHKKKLLYTRAKRFLFAKLRAFILSYCHKLWNLISCENISIYQYATAWTLLEIRSTKPGQ